MVPDRRHRYPMFQSAGPRSGGSDEGCRTVGAPIVGRKVELGTREVVNMGFPLGAVPPSGRCGGRGPIPIGCPGYRPGNDGAGAHEGGSSVFRVQLMDEDTAGGPRRPRFCEAGRKGDGCWSAVPVRPGARHCESGCEALRASARPPSVSSGILRIGK